ncbi:hypothetical protein Hanom_Chr11g01028661 [Helianthus anomalus]
MTDGPKMHALNCEIDMIPQLNTSIDCQTRVVSHCYCKRHRLENKSIGMHKHYLSSHIVHKRITRSKTMVFCYRH